MVYAEQSVRRESVNDVSKHTTRHSVHFVLNEIVDEWNQCTKKQATEDFAIFDGLGIRWAERQTSQGPRKCGNKV